MRAGNCTVQHSLTAEAANVVKQSVALARRRGHAQVTPLHVANTMLSTATGLLKAACLQSHSHPLQCKALELCFNVALNRLPASSSCPMSGHNSHHPSISNALVAAFKRAQAHQRRGSIENQQQPLLAVKIELGQLMISILDDPSVSRVMREAGFSSTQIKSNVEHAVSLELCSQSTPSTKSKENNTILNLNLGRPRPSEHVRNEDSTAIISSFINKRRRNIVVVGECVVNIEGIVGAVMDKIEEGEDVCEELRGVKFITLPLLTFGKHSKEEVEQKLEDLRSTVSSFLEKGIVLYLGDLKWITDYSASSGGHKRSSFYCPVDHMVMELGRLVHRIGEKGRFWLMGIATFQTYIRCKTGHHPLETVWRLQPVTIPAGGLGLSLFPNSEGTENSSCSLKLEGEENKLRCFHDGRGSANVESEAQRLHRNNCKSGLTTSSLPSWLQDENKKLINYDQNCVSVKELCAKWSSICSSSQKEYQSSERTVAFSSLSPSSSVSCFTHGQQYTSTQQLNQAGWIMFESQNQQRKPQTLFRKSASSDNLTAEPETCLMIYIPEHEDSKPEISPDSAASSNDFMQLEYTQRFKEFNADNLNRLCTILEGIVPWQKDIIPEIAGTILQCRSGMLKRKEKQILSDAKEETWFFFQGVDVHAKEKIAKELAKAVFGSYSNFVSITLSSFSSTRADSDSTDQDLRNKRSRDEQSCSYVKRFAEAVSANPHCVFFVEDVDQADYCSQMKFKRAIERGRVANSIGEEVSLKDAIVILSCENFSSRSRACSPTVRTKITDGPDEEKVAGMEETSSPTLSLDLNISFDDDDDCAVNIQSNIDDVGLLDSVDRRITFKFQDL